MANFVFRFYCFLGFHVLFVVRLVQSHIFKNKIGVGTFAISQVGGGEVLPKINPGSNIHGDNDTATSRPGGMQDISIPEPKKTDKNMLQCPICNSNFSSNEDYISHFMARHQPATTETEMSPSTT